MNRPGIGIGIFVRKGDDVIFLKRKGAHGEGTWCLPGGHLEFNETIFEAAKREVKEEANVSIKNLKVLGFTEDFFEKENKHYITIFVNVDYESGEAKLMEPEKSSEIGWFDENNLPKPLFLPGKNLLEGKYHPK